MTKILISSGANLSITDSEGYTCLHWAASVGHPSVVRLLTSSGCNINQLSAKGETPLHCAASAEEKIPVCFKIILYIFPKM